MKDKNNNNSMQRSLRLLQEMDPQFIPLSVLDGLLKTLFGYAPVVVLSQVINNLTEDRNAGNITGMAFAGVLCFFLIHLAQVWSDKKINIKGQHLSYKFETLMAEKTLNMELTQMEGEEAKELQGRVKADRSWGSGFFGVTAKIRLAGQHLMGFLVSSVIIMPLLIDSIGQGNWLFSGTVAAAIMLSIMIAVFFDKWYGKREKTAMEAMTKMELGSRYQYLSEGGGALSYRDMKELLLYKVSDLIGPTIEEEKEKVRARAIGLSGLNAAGGVIKGGASGILYGLSLGAATFWAFLGEISVGSVIQSSRAIYQMAESLTAFFQIYAEMKVDMQRLASTLDYLELGAERDDGAKKESRVSTPKEVQTIEFEKVTFTYPGASAKAIDCLSLSIQGDKKTALVGRNGSGKTTLVNLLCRLYRPDEGVIRLNGIDIWDYKESEYWDLLAVVFQDFTILSFPMGNVVACREDYNDECVESALKKAGMPHWIKAHENGIRTMLYREYTDDGVELSGGEAQKTAIARAVYKDAPLVVLDEPAAALDPVSEYRIYTDFSGLTGSKGIIYISHRLASCQFCDDIIVMENGRLAERGTHKELVGQEGGYRKMWEAQAQYYTNM